MTKIEMINKNEQITKKTKYFKGILVVKKHSVYKHIEFLVKVDSIFYILNVFMADSE